MELTQQLAGKSFAQESEFLTSHKLIVKESLLHPSLFLVTYNLRTPPNWTLPFVIQCRGIILEKGTNKIVCYPFDKFFNYAEPTASKIDWPTSKVYDKIDGSLAKAYFYNGKWIIATNGMVDANEIDLGDGFTWQNLFWEALSVTLGKDVTSFNNTGKFPLPLDENLTYIFEVVHYKQTIVIKYEKPFVYHLATRSNLPPYNEVSVHLQGIPAPKTFKLSCVNDCLEMTAKYKTADEGEGFVVCDAKYNRVKIKSKTYLEAHGGPAEDMQLKLLKLLLMGEKDETLAYSPHFKQEMEGLEKALNDFKSCFLKGCEAILSVECSYIGGDPRQLQKQRALVIKNAKGKNVLFQWMNSTQEDGTRASPQQYLDSLLSVENLDSKKNKISVKEHIVAFIAK